jgi:hypothetical protein
MMDSFSSTQIRVHQSVLGHLFSLLACLPNVCTEIAETLVLVYLHVNVTMRPPVFLEVLDPLIEGLRDVFLRCAVEIKRIQGSNHSLAGIHTTVSCISAEVGEQIVV